MLTMEENKLTTEKEMYELFDYLKNNQIPFTVSLKDQLKRRINKHERLVKTAILLYVTGEIDWEHTFGCLENIYKSKNKNIGHQSS